MRDRVLGFSVSSSFFSSSSDDDVLSEVAGGIADVVAVRAGSGVVEAFAFEKGSLMVISG